MNADSWRDLLQQHLDGELSRDELLPRLPTSELPAVERLLAGVAALTPLAAPPALTSRLCDALLLESRPGHRPRPRPRPRWRRLASTAGLIAAALLLTLGIGKAPVRVARLSDPMVSRGEPPIEPLRHSVEKAGTALARITSRTAERMGDGALVPPPVSPTLPPMGATIEPPLEPLREASAGVQSGLAPMTDSARRAVELFLRDLPGSRTTNPKPG